MWTKSITGKKTKKIIMSIQMWDGKWNEPKFYNTFKGKWYMGQSDSTAGQMLALHMANPVSILSIPNSILSLSVVTLEHCWVWPYTQKKINYIKVYKSWSTQTVPVLLGEGSMSQAVLRGLGDNWAAQALARPVSVKAQWCWVLSCATRTIPSGTGESWSTRIKLRTLSILSLWSIPVS